MGPERRGRRTGKVPGRVDVGLSYFCQLDMNLDIPEKRDSPLRNGLHVSMSAGTVSSRLIDAGGPSLLSVCQGRVSFLGWRPEL